MDKCEKTNWYVAYTYPNAEKKIKKALTKYGISAYLPLRKVARQWSDRVKKLEVPLFPNYIFVNISDREYWKVLEMPGVVRFLTSDGKPSLISIKEINAIKIIESGDFEITEEESFEVGNKVVVTDGVLSGLEGVLIDRKGKRKFLLSLVNFGKIISLTVPASVLTRAE